MTQTFGADELFQLLQNLLPTGIAFPRDPDSIQSALLHGLSDAEAQTVARMTNLLVDAFPTSTVELLPEWEASTGLPDLCWGPNPTLEQRQQSLLARLTATGGQSIPYFEDFCLKLGFPNITFEEFTAFRVGMHVGFPIYSTAWNYAIAVHGFTIVVHYFLVGHDTAGEPLATWVDNPIACELRRVMPAHLYLLIDFT